MVTITYPLPSQLTYERKQFKIQPPNREWCFNSFKIADRRVIVIPFRNIKRAWAIIKEWIWRSKCHVRTIVMGQKLLIFELQIFYPQKNVKPNDDTFDEAS